MPEYRSTRHYIESKVDEYKKFMGIDTFPDYVLETRELTLDKSIKTGFDSLATARYDFNMRKNILTVASQVVTLKADYVIFHELTHILDEETHCKGDKIKHMANAGFTEYHASQVEMMKLIGVASIDAPCRFSDSQCWIASKHLVVRSLLGNL